MKKKDMANTNLLGEKEREERERERERERNTNALNKKV